MTQTRAHHTTVQTYGIPRWPEKQLHGPAMKSRCAANALWPHIRPLPSRTNAGGQAPPATTRCSTPGWATRIPTQPTSTKPADSSGLTTAATSRSGPAPGRDNTQAGTSPGPANGSPPYIPATLAQALETGGMMARTTMEGRHEFMQSP